MWVPCAQRQGTNNMDRRQIVLDVGDDVMTLKHQSSALWPFLTGGFPSQEARNAELWCFQFMMSSWAHPKPSTVPHHGMLAGLVHLTETFREESCGENRRISGLYEITLWNSPKLKILRNLVHSEHPISVAQSFWKFAQRTAVWSLSCSEIYLNDWPWNKLWENAISRDLSLKQFHGVYCT